MPERIDYETPQPRKRWSAPFLLCVILIAVFILMYSMLIAFKLAN